MWVSGEPLSLADQAGLAVLERLHEKAYKLENDYTSIWLPSLTTAAYNIEESISINDVDPTEVILKYTAKQDEERRSRAKHEEQARSRSRSRRRNRENERPKTNDRRMAEDSVAALRGIPQAADAEEYIRYRKCLYVKSIKEYKDQLIQQLSPPALEHLLSLITHIYRRRREMNEMGIFTLQTMLLTEYTSEFLFNSSNLQKTFRTVSGIPCVDHRIGPTILRSCLVEATRLTKLSLERVCTDSLLKLVGSVATNILYLNISHSLVTDQGLFDLVGVKVDSAGTRERLPRLCKQTATDTERIVKNLCPRWSKVPGVGAVNLVHVETENLRDLDWSHISSYSSRDPKVPIDAGFVALLTYLPKLKVFKTEKGGRSVVAYVQSKRRQSVEPLQLEVLYETHPNEVILVCLAQYCPQLRDLRVDWDDYSSHNSGREDWIPLLSQFYNLTHFRTSYIDYKTSNLRDTLPVIGHNLVTIHLQEICSFHYSLTKQIRESCPNLVKFCLLMTTNNLIGSMAEIQVERDIDFSFEMANASRKQFSKLKELHLIGPLGRDFVRYTVFGCDNLKVLSLGIEWPDPTFCNVIPNTRKDLLGRDYLEEVRTANSLSELEEIHLFTQFRRGSANMDENFALYVGTEFKKLKHFGTFKYWNIDNPTDVIRRIRQTNRHITFDNEYVEVKDRPKEGKLMGFLKDDKCRRACSWLPLKPRTFSLMDQVTQILVGPGIFMPDEDDDDDNLNNSDQESVNASDDEDLGEMPLIAGLDPNCVIQ